MGPYISVGMVNQNCIKHEIYSGDKFHTLTYAYRHAQLDGVDKKIHMFAFNEANEIRPYMKGVSNTTNISEIKSRPPTAMSTS